MVTENLIFRLLSGNILSRNHNLTNKGEVKWHCH